MAKIVPIVEGEGEVGAVPKLLVKLLNERGRYDLQIARPKNANGRQNLDKPGGLEKFVELSWRERDCGATLVLIDADKECAVALARDYASRIQSMGVRFTVVIAVAKCEYEAWFLASLKSIAGREWQGHEGLPEGLDYPGEVESLVGVKGWLDRQLQSGHSYKPAQDQAAVTAMLDSELARARSRSFRRLCHALEEAVTAIDTGRVIVTPEISSQSHRG